MSEEVVQEKSEIDALKEEERIKVAKKELVRKSFEADHEEKKAVVEKARGMTLEELQQEVLRQQEENKKLHKKFEETQSYIRNRERESVKDFISNQSDRYPTILETGFEDLVIEQMEKQGISISKAADLVEDKLYEIESKKMQRLLQSKKYKGESQETPRSNQEFLRDVPKFMGPQKQQVEHFKKDERTSYQMKEDFFNNLKRGGNS